MMGRGEVVSPSQEERFMSTVPRPARARNGLATVAGRITLVTDRFELVIPPDIRQIDQFRVWASDEEFPEHVRVTFDNGEVILDMSNEEINTHVALKGSIYATLFVLVTQLKLGKIYPDGVLLVNEEGKVSNNPDAVFLSRDAIESRRVRLVPRKGAEHLYRELEGTPDWVLEVVSDSSVKKDTVRLREGYHRAGIPEYWLVDGRGEELLFQILNYRKSGYVASPSRDGWLRSKVFGRSFRLERALDDFGLWEYKLHVRDE
jgi:Uma2 family endonuclease